MLLPSPSPLLHRACYTPNMFCELDFLMPGLHPYSSLAIECTAVLHHNMRSTHDCLWESAEHKAPQPSSVLSATAFLSRGKAAVADLQYSKPSSMDA